MAEPVIINYTNRTNVHPPSSSFPLWILAIIPLIVGVATFLFLRRKKKVHIKLIRFLNNDFITIQNYKVDDLKGLKEIRIKGKRWLIDEDVHPKTLKLKSKLHPCYLIHDEVAKPLEVDVKTKSLKVELNPEVVDRLTVMSALKELLKPKITTSSKQMLLYILMGIVCGIGIGIVVGGFIR